MERRKKADVDKAVYDLQRLYKRAEALRAQVRDARGKIEEAERELRRLLCLPTDDESPHVRPSLF